MKISVRNLVEFVYRTGDISFEFSSSSRNTAGVKGHQKVQRNRGAGYQAEVALEHTAVYDGLTISVGGRLDGLWQTDEGVILEEIKTTTLPLKEILSDSFFLHWAQVKTYAYIYMVKEELKSIAIQLTYYNIDTDQTKEFREKITLKEATSFFQKMVKKYIAFAQKVENRKRTRDISAASMTFPFKKYRPGQRELAVTVYKTIERSERFFFQAATGIGKTVAVLFPAFKALGNNLCDKIFYLTAKTMGKTIAEQCLGLLGEQGLNSLAVTLTAKDKICFKPDAACHPDECEYAKGYYDRVRKAINDGLGLNIVTRQKIIEIAENHQVCPFEFSLDLSLWADIIICDYNYAFDPRVYLRRFFQDERESYTFLIDEAHNLVDRSRAMYSVELFKKDFLAVRRSIKKSSPGLYKQLTALNTYLLNLKKDLVANKKELSINRVIPDDLLKLLRQFCYTAEAQLVKDKIKTGKDELIDLYFAVTAFLRISEIFDNYFVFYYELMKENDLRIKIFCLDPSKVMKENLKRAKSSIFFSATMTPLGYFNELLGGEPGDRKSIINSPFPLDNREVIICPQVVTIYKKRKETLQDVADYIKAAVSAKKGNYITYFSSYEYMNQVLEILSEDKDDPDLQMSIVQKQDMTEEAREEYVTQFNNGKGENLLAFAVLGGVFGEGIDLIGDKLIGAIIVGVGLPQLSLERELIREFFQAKNGKGYDYAYKFPGMNRVLQAAGRVIRSENDTGVVILLDQRFANLEYQRLFPNEWSNFVAVQSPETLYNVLLGFWGKKE
ncbi:MAG: ATP-dependent DNA helicase [Candidatus Cloacimonetes bacterium]|nr:ATP-dependent DNA helicase [Candidatus Cloacimonadota bacterium]